MKKKIKRETRKKAVNDVDPSRFTIHDSRSLSRFTVFTDSRFLIACIVFLILIIYSNTLNAPFQWDEGNFIVDNPIIKDLHYFIHPSDAKEFPLYTALINRYIGYLTFALNDRIHGPSVTGYHIVNIAIHIANSVLVYLFVLLTFRTPFFLIKTDSGQAGIDSRLTSHDSRSLIAFFSAAIFAVHPLQTEAVTYVFQRFASLVTFFYLLSLVFYIKARLMTNSKNDSGQAGMTTNGAGIGSRSTFHGSRFTFFLISFFSAVLAMKTKENAFTLPIVIALYEFCFFNSSSLLPLDKARMGGVTRRLLYLAPILLTLLIIPLTLMSLTGAHQIDPGAYGARQFSRWDYFYTQFRVIVTYLRLLFFPVNQNLDYDYPVFKSFFNLPVLLSFVFLFLLLGLGAYLVIKTKDNTKEKDSGQAGMTKNGKGLATSCRHSGLSGIVSRFTNSRCFGSTSHVSRPLSDSRPFRLMGFGILWFFITLSVESSIVPLPMLIDEYRMYLPSIGMIICVVTGMFWVFARFTKSRCFGSTSHDSRPLVSRPLIVFLVLIIGTLSVTTYLRNDLWGDPIKLWEDVTKKSPRSSKAHYNLGLFYQNRNMPDKAMEQYLITINLSPGFAEAYNNIGHIYEGRNIPDKAMVYYQIAIDLSPNFPEAHYNLGLFYQARNMPDKAEAEYLTAIKLKPDYEKAHYYLGLSYQARNMFDKAMEQYLTAIKLKPDHAEARFNLGFIYLSLNMPDKALSELQIASNLKPDDAEAHFNLGAIYYRMGQMENAHRELTAGLKIKPDDQQAQQLLKTVKGRES